MSLAVCRPPALPHCVAPSAPACAGGGEGLQGTKIHKLSPLFADTNDKHPGGYRDVRGVNASGLRGDHKAVLPFPPWMLCSAKQGAETFEFKGCCCFWLEWKGCPGPGLSHRGLGSVPRGQET